ncbi:AN1-type zinc finger protein 2B-like isoform X2 [Ambystoma mexicanum]
MCNNPIPLRKGEKPDIVVGEHRARNCQPDSAHGKQKIFKNRCVKAGCKKKELIKVVCDHCQENFCIKHRHPVDHDCKGGVRILSKAGHAAIMRAQETCDVARSKSAMRETATDQKPQSISASLLPRSCGMSFAATCYNGLSEEEVLRRVLEVSLTETTKKNDEKSSTHDEDVASPSTTIDEGIQSQNKKIAIGGQ